MNIARTTPPEEVGVRGFEMYHHGGTLGAPPLLKYVSIPRERGIVGFISSFLRRLRPPSSFFPCSYNEINKKRADNPQENPDQSRQHHRRLFAEPDRV